MSDDRERLVASLKEAFDASFAEPPRVAQADRERFLAIRVANEAMALRIGEVAALEPRRKIVPLPGAPAGLLGIAGVRGRLVSVFSLSSLLGRTGDDADHWISVDAADESVAFVFGALEGFRTTAAADVHRAAGNGDKKEHAEEFVRIESTLRRIVSLSSCIEPFRRGQAATTSKES